MFRPMRRIKQQLSEEECIDILKNEPRGVLAVSGENEYPYAVPMNHVYADDKLYFHSSMEGHKKDAITNQDRVSFCVMDRGTKLENEWWYTFKSVLVFGRIHCVADEEDKIRILTLLGSKYFPNDEYTIKEIDKHLKRTLVLELDIEHMTGKRVTEK